MKKLFKKEYSDEEAKYHYNSSKNQTKSHLKIIRLIAIAIFIYSLISIIIWQRDNSNTKKIMSSIYDSMDFTNTIQITDENGATADVVDFSKIKKKNSSTVAWVKVNGTDIDYPVVQHKDNDYYLTHSFDKSKNSAGWIFLDYENSKKFDDRNTVIYGHNRRDGSMFSTLQNILKKDWYSNENNQTITLYTPEKTIHYQVFSVYKIKSETYYTKNDFKDDAEYEKFLKKITDRSVHDFKTEVTRDDDILTLSTCGNNKIYRVVLHAKRIN